MSASARPRNLALFGGTFDPVHEGHLDIARKAHETCHLDEVIFIPCRQSPHKNSVPAVSETDRLAMLTLATRDLPWASVNPLEINAPPPSFTWKTAEILRAQNPPNTRFHLLIGLDQWKNLPFWQCADRLAASLHFIVVGRDGQPAPRVGYDATFIFGDHPASASDIRARLALDQAPDWLPPQVSHYIEQRNLYQSES